MQPAKVAFLFSEGHSLLRNDLQQFYIKYQCRAGNNMCTGLLIAVSEVCRDKQFPLTAYWHQLQRFYPSLDHAIHREVNWLTPVYRTVENRSIDQCSMVVAFHLVGKFRFRT